MGGNYRRGLEWFTIEGCAPKVCRTDRWTGADATLAGIGILAASHGLLQAVYPEWAATYGTRLPKHMLAALRKGQVQDCIEDDPELVAPLGAGAGVLEGALVEESAEDAWRKRLASCRFKALALVALSTFVARLVVLSVPMLAQQAFMRSAMFVSGAQWEADQDAKAAFADARGLPFVPMIRAMVAARLELEKKFFSKLASLLSDAREWLAVPRSGHVREHLALAFRLVSAMGAAAHRHLHEPHKKYPWKGWGLAAGVLPGTLESELLQEKGCMLDQWTSDMVKRHGHRLGADDVRADFLATAMLVQADNGSVEAKWGHIRRRVLASSNQTHTQRLSQASSTFVWQQSAAAEAGRVRPETSPETHGDDDGGDDQPAKRQRRTPGGGGMRAFIHKEAPPNQHTDFKAMAQAYNALTPAERAPYEELGRQATLQHRRGHSSFGPSAREAARSRLKARRQEEERAAEEVARADLVNSLSDEPIAERHVSALAMPDALAIVSQPCESWTSFMSVVQRAVRVVSAQRAAESRALADALVAWAAAAQQRRETQVMLGVLEGVRDDRLEMRPKPTFMNLTRWSFGVDGLAASAMRFASLRGDLAATRAARSSIERDWASRHELVISDDCPAISREVPAKLTTPCFEAGVCVCSKLGRQVRLMAQQLNSLMKVAFPPGSQQRAELAEGHFAILLCGEPHGSGLNSADGAAGSDDGEEAREHSHFLHVADHALSPFLPTYQRMVLESLGNGPTKARAQAEWVSQASFLSGLDRNLQWSLRLFRLRGGLGALPDFVPERQEYDECRFDLPCTIFWKGGNDCEKSARFVWKDIDASTPEGGASDSANGAHEHDGEDGRGSDVDGSPQEPNDDEFDDSDQEALSDVDFFGESDDEAGKEVLDGAPDADQGGAGGEQPSVGEQVAPEVLAGDNADRGVIHYAVPGGYLRYYPSSRRFAAHCEVPEHGTCRRMKTANEGPAPAQGRPLGYLMAWLEDCNYPSQQSHLHSTHSLSLEARQRGREVLKGFASARMLFEVERPQRPGEPEEPLDCP